MYALFHPSFKPKAWHVFVTYIICTWLAYIMVLFANKALPFLSKIGCFLIPTGVTITIIVCAAMPAANGRSYASDNFGGVIAKIQQDIPRMVFVFVAGMLNGTFAAILPHLLSETDLIQDNSSR